jgi:hypothetical protein
MAAKIGSASTDGVAAVVMVAVESVVKDIEISDRKSGRLKAPTLRLRRHPRPRKRMLLAMGKFEASQSSG